VVAITSCNEKRCSPGVAEESYDAANNFWLMHHAKGSESAKEAELQRGCLWFIMEVLNRPAFLWRLPRGSMCREKWWPSVLLQESQLLASSQYLAAG